MLDANLKIIYVGILLMMMVVVAAVMLWGGPPGYRYVLTFDVTLFCVYTVLSIYYCY